MTITDVRAVHAAHKLALPKVYTDYKLSRLSCSFCILSALHDLVAAAATEEAVPAYRTITRLEVDSTFSFQSSRWLADIAPQLLDTDVAARLHDAKLKAQEREEIEAAIPEHLLYTKQGWPRTIPTYAEAAMLAEIRRQIGALMGFTSMNYTTAEAVIARYTELYNERHVRDAKTAKTKARRDARAALDSQEAVEPICQQEQTMLKQRNRVRSEHSSVQLDYTQSLLL